MERYDYIIAGAGCAGLSLLVHWIQSGHFRDQKILLVDRSPKVENDRTWCFWETEPGPFEEIVSAAWKQLDVHFNGFSKRLEIDPYVYKMIRAADYYRYCFDLIATQPNIAIKYGEIEALEVNDKEATITLSGEQISADYIFSSIVVAPPAQQPGKHYLLQHFKGWVIEADSAAFDSSTATLMDFRVPQDAGTTFVYVLPLAPNKAMVEATLFSQALLPDGDYDELLGAYLATHFSGVKYQVLEEERGVIPMSNHNFVAHDGRFIYLGTAGGKTKASTGYTFKPIQAHSAQLTAQLIKHGHPYLKTKKGAARFSFYDSILLHLLANDILSGAAIFERLFARNSPQQIFRFLDDASQLNEELKLTLTLQKGPFIKAAVREILNGSKFW